MYETYPHPPTPRTPRTPQPTLSLRKGRASWTLYSSAPLTAGCSWHRFETTVDFAHPGLGSRPDPIQRAWSHLEAKWGMAATQQGGTPRPPRPLELRSALLGWLRKLSPRTPLANSEIRSQQGRR